MKRIPRAMMALACTALAGTLACGASSRANDPGVQAPDTGDVPTETAGDVPAAELPAAELPAADVPPDVVAAPLVVTPFVFPVTAAGLALDHGFTATGGVPPYVQWTVIRGDLPDGLALAPATGALAGTPATEGLHTFVVQVTDSTGATAAELFGVRVGMPGTDGDLHRRATAFQDVFQARHDWNGFTFTNKTPDDPGGNFRLACLGDSSFATGQCTMAMAYRDAVLRTDESRALVKKMVASWRFFQRLTGVPGLIGRSYGRVDYPWEDGHHSTGFWPDNPDSRNYRGEGEFDGWIWVGDVSRDQASGAVLGVASAYDLSDDPLTKKTAAEFLAALADHVWSNNLDFMDKDGQLTKYGNVDGEKLEGWPVPSGLNAAAALTWFLAAAHAAESEGLDDAGRFRDHYQELLSRGYVDIIRDHMWVYDGYSTIYYNTYMAYENLFHLARLENDPVLGPQVKAAFRDTLWLNTDDYSPNRRGQLEGNPVKTAWYLFATGDRDPVALWEALGQVIVFREAPLRDHAVKNSDDPAIPKNPDFPTEAMRYLPSNRLPPDMVIWHRDTFLLDGGEDSGEERTGCDYLLPYWMGRYQGWIDAGW